MFKKIEKLAPKSYILPLHKRAGNIDLFALITQMCFLAVLVTSIHLALFERMKSWRLAIEYQSSIEIPASNENYKPISAAQHERLESRIIDVLENSNFAKDISPMSQQDISALIEPWLGGDNKLLDSVPLPKVINFKLVNTSKTQINKLEQTIQKIAPRARLQNHANWLDKFLATIKTANFIGLIITIITIAATILIIFSAVRTRMLIYKDEIELLHIMGAHDSFILKQFIYYIGCLCAIACLLGYALSALLVTALSWSMSSGQDDMIPTFSLNVTQLFMLMLIPLSIFTISLVIVRTTLLAKIKHTSYKK